MISNSSEEGKKQGNPRRNFLHILEKAQHRTTTSHLDAGVHLHTHETPERKKRIIGRIILLLADLFAAGSFVVQYDLVTHPEHVRNTISRIADLMYEHLYSQEVQTKKTEVVNVSTGLPSVALRITVPNLPFPISSVDISDMHHLLIRVHNANQEDILQEIRERVNDARPQSDPFYTYPDTDLIMAVINQNFVREVNPETRDAKVLDSGRKIQGGYWYEIFPHSFDEEGITRLQHLETGKILDIDEDQLEKVYPLEDPDCVYVVLYATDEKMIIGQDFGSIEKSAVLHGVLSTHIVTLPIIDGQVVYTPEKNKGLPEQYGYFTTELPSSNAYSYPYSEPYLVHSETGNLYVLRDGTVHLAIGGQFVDTEDYHMHPIFLENRTIGIEYIYLGGEIDSTLVSIFDEHSFQKIVVKNERIENFVIAMNVQGVTADDTAVFAELHVSDGGKSLLRYYILEEDNSIKTTAIDISKEIELLGATADNIINNPYPFNLSFAVENGQTVLKIVLFEYNDSFRILTIVLPS